MPLPAIKASGACRCDIGKPRRSDAGPGWPRFFRRTAQSNHPFGTGIEPVWQNTRRYRSTWSTSSTQSKGFWQRGQESNLPRTVLSALYWFCRPVEPPESSSPQRLEGIEAKGACQAATRPLLRVFKLSGFVARNLSGRHSYLEEVTYEANGAATGDSEDEISRSV